MCDNCATHHRDKLFQKQGRNLQPTEISRTVFRYADEIFSLGEELVGILRGLSSGRVTELTVGVVNVMPKLMVLELLQPAIQNFDDLKLICLEDTMENLVVSLRIDNIDIVLSDFQSPSYDDTRVYNHQRANDSTSGCGGDCQPFSSWQFGIF